MEPTQIRSILHTDTLVLRQKLLRPNLTPEQCVFPGDTDDTTIHLGCFSENELVGVASLYHRANIEIHPGMGYQLRAMATLKSAQGRGFGTALIRHMLALLKDKGADYLWANARVSAVGFYAKNNFSLGDHEFMIEGVGKHVIVSHLFSRIDI